MNHKLSQYLDALLIGALLAFTLPSVEGTQLGNCPSYCKCLTSLQLCNVTEREPPFLPCGVTWVDLRIRIKTRDLRPQIFAICSFVRKLYFRTGSRLDRLTATTFKGLNSLTTFNAEYGGSLVSLEENILTNTPKLSVIKISNNQLKSISENALTGCDNLLTFDVTKNLLSSIPKRLFSHCSLLKRVSLAQNKLRFIHSDTFRGLKNLIYLILSNNHISSIQPNTLLHSNRLKTLKLDHNNLTDIGESTFRKLFSLETLDLNTNNIQYIHKSAFNDLISLKYLVLSDNPRIGSLTWRHFHPTENIVQLNLFNSIICVVEVEPKPTNIVVLRTFRQYPRCSGQQRPPEQSTNSIITTKQQQKPILNNNDVVHTFNYTGDSPSSNTKVSLPFQGQDPAPRSIMNPTREQYRVEYIPIWMLVLVCSLSLALLLVLIVLISYCAVQNKKVRRLTNLRGHPNRQSTNPPRGAPCSYYRHSSLPMVYETDETSFLATTI